MDNISKAVSTSLKSPLSSEIASVFSAAQSTIAHSAILHSAIVHSPVVESKIAQSPVAQPKVFQSELPESEFLNLSFDELSKVAVRAHRSNQMQNAFQAKAALEVKSKENFLEMPLEKLMNLPVRMATLGKNDKDKDKQDTQDVTSDPTSINFQAIPVFSKQALESVSSYQTNTENTSTVSTDTDTDTSTTTTTTTTTVPPVPPPSTVIPIALPTLVPRFIATVNNVGTVSVFLKQADGTFGSETMYVVGGTPSQVISADFNQDGIPDLAVSNSTPGPNIFSILLGTAIGVFGPPTNYPIATFSVSIATGDFNGDGILDILVPESNGSLISLFLGTGTGSFGSATNFAGGGGPLYLAVADFNKDGFLDFAVNYNTVGNVAIFLGTGTGSFLAPLFFIAGDSNQRNIAVGDFNNDNIPDLAIAGFNTNVVSIYIGTGTGTFSAANNFFAGPAAQYVALGDFNGDGILDLAVANGNTTISILLGVGDGTFGSPTSYAACCSANNIAVADFNGDGKLDLAVATGGSNTISILFGNGDGSFQSPISYAVTGSPRGLTIGFVPAGVSGCPINLALVDPIIDINDIVTVTIHGIPSCWVLNTGVNNLDGSWTAQTKTPELLTVTTAADFVGARALEVDMSWVSMDGEVEHVFFKDNIEAYAIGAPIFALPGDNLTGSSHADIFVISKSQPCINDKIFNFDIMLDKIDLINFENVNDFSDLIVQNDSCGNALIHLGSNDQANQSVLLYGVDANQVTDSNFLFNIIPHTINTDKIDIGAGSIMPFYGEFENNGTIQVDGTLIIQGDITGTGKIILGNSGVLELKGHLAQDIIFETSTMPMMFDHLDFTLAGMTTVSLQILLEYNQNVA